MIILRIKEVKRTLGYRSDATIYQHIRNGVLTDGVRMGDRAKGWPDYEIMAIVQARIAGQSETQIRELVCQLKVRRSELGFLGWMS